MKTVHCKRCSIVLNNRNPEQWGVVWWPEPNKGGYHVCARCFLWLKKANNRPEAVLPPMPAQVAAYKPKPPEYQSVKRVQPYGPRTEVKQKTKALAFALLLHVYQKAQSGEQIGDEFGISRVRVNQLLRGWLPAEVGEDVVKITGARQHSVYKCLPAGERLLRQEKLI